MSTRMATANENPGIGQAAAAGEAAAAAFVAKFTRHHQQCISLAKHFTETGSDLKDSAALSQLCRASQEMLEQAKEAQTLTEIYLALDESHRDVIRPIIIERFKHISKLAKTSWGRFCDSVKLVQVSRPAIAKAQRDFGPHAREFQDALRAFIALSTEAG
ncbi:MAG TPA: hypothetical protein VJ719_12275 [Chthoniobacterales bacterium]|nr:hypothetical protein [Chthoniobacterales bacterium]